MIISETFDNIMLIASTTRVAGYSILLYFPVNWLVFIRNTNELNLKSVDCSNINKNDTFLCI